MAEWTSCPHCQLKHTRRPDGCCPRCRQAVDADSAAPPIESFSPVSAPMAAEPDASPPAEPGRLTAAARLAGAVLIVNAGFILLEKLLVPSGGGFEIGLPTILIDLLIGTSLAVGQAKWLPLAKFRVIAGAVVFAGLHLYNGQPAMALFQVFFSAGLILLLFAPATIGVGRMLAYSSVIGLYFFFEVIGLARIAIGNNPLAAIQAAMGIGLEREPVTVLQGDAFPYRLTPTGGKWYLRTKEAMRKDNPDADRWIVRPDRDVHILVIAEKFAPNMRVDMDRFVEVVVENARANTKNFQQIGVWPIPSPLESVRLVETRSTVAGFDVHGYHGLFFERRVAYQVYAFAPEKNFARIADELKTTVLSFQVD